MAPAWLEWRRALRRLVSSPGYSAIVVAALAIGLAGSFAVARYIRSQLYEVSARDPVSFTTVAITLTVVALLASWIPTRRALSIDPATARRTE